VVGRAEAAAERIAPMLLAAICLTPLVGLLNAFALAPFLPVIADEMHTSVALLGQVPAAMQLVATGLGLVVGPMADRYGYRRLLLIGLAALIAGAGATVFASSVLALLAAAVIGAASRAILQPVSITIAGTRFQGETRRKAIAFVTAAISGAGTVGVPLLTTVAAFYGWRGAYVALVLLGLFALALVARGLPVDEPGAGESVGLHGLMAAYRPLLRDRATMMLIGSNFLRSVGQWCGSTYMAAYLVQAHGLTPQVGGLALALSGGGQLIGSLASGRVSGLPPRPTLAVVSLVVGVTLGAALALPIGPAAVMGLVLVGAVVGGLGNVTSTTLLLTETSAGRGTTLTLNQSGFSLASATGSSIGGFLLAIGGYHAIGLAVPIFSAGSAACVLLSAHRRAGTARASLPV
jgi:predicted MFS family arabinose efflux permease